MKTQDLKKTILKVTKRKNVEKLEWDSLSHLNILIVQAYLTLDKQVLLKQKE